jgi:hypothetical protein
MLFSCCDLADLDELFGRNLDVSWGCLHPIERGRGFMSFKADLIIYVPMAVISIYRWCFRRARMSGHEAWINESARRDITIESDTSKRYINDAVAEQEYNKSAGGQRRQLQRDVIAEHA